MHNKKRVRPDHWGCSSPYVGRRSGSHISQVRSINLSKTRKSRDRFVELLGLYDAGEQLEKKYMNRDYLINAINHYNLILNQYDYSDRKNP